MGEKHTIVVEARLDVDDVLKALSFLKKETGLSPRSRGEFLKMCVQGISSLNTEEEPERTTEEKLHLLQSAFGGVINLGKSRHGRIQVNPSISRSMQIASIRDEDGVDSMAERIRKFMEQGEEKI